jgi:hypothetical protein
MTVSAVARLLGVSLPACSCRGGAWPEAAPKPPGQTGTWSRSAPSWSQGQDARGSLTRGRGRELVPYVKDALRSSERRGARPHLDPSSQRHRARRDRQAALWMSADADRRYCCCPIRHGFGNLGELHFHYEVGGRGRTVRTVPLLQGLQPERGGHMIRPPGIQMTLATGT